MRLENDQRRAQLLALAKRAFSEQSYDEVSIDDLAREARISKGLLYHYFPTKRDLYVAGLTEIANDLVSAITKVPEDAFPIDRVRMGLDAYLEHVRGLGRADGTIDTIEYRLHGIMRDVEKDRPLRKVTPAIARQLYAQRVAERKPDTHIGELNTASGMFAWALERGWVSANPFADIAPVGRRGARRTKLRIEETRAFVDHALADGRPEGVAAAMAVLMGMRATEVTSRVVRDVDDGCRVLWIDEDGGTKLKTESSERHLEIPSDLRPYVLRLIMGKKPTDKIFGDVDRHWLRYHVQRISKAVGNRVTTQALRRTHTRVFNTLNQLWKDVNAAGTAAVTTTFGYDNNGNLTTTNAPLSRNSTILYDELNRL